MIPLVVNPIGDFFVFIKPRSLLLYITFAWTQQCNSVLSFSHIFFNTICLLLSSFSCYHAGKH